MVLIQLEIPEKLNKKLKIYSIKNNYVDKRDALIFLLEKLLSKEEKK